MGTVTYALNYSITEAGRSQFKTCLVYVMNSRSVKDALSQNNKKLTQDQHLVTKLPRMLITLP